MMRFIRFELRSVAILFVLMCIGASAWGQSAGLAEISGTVRDQTGAVVPGAMVTVKSLETAANVAQACGVESPLLAACRNAWAAAEARLGSGADQTALIRWLETLAPAAGKSEA